MKRFYKMVTIAEHDGPGYQVCLDGQPVKTPARQLLSIPHAGLADAVAKEWADQGEHIDPETMPLMQLCVTAQEQVKKGRPAMSKAALAYLDTDLLCYRADQPPELAAHEQKSRDHYLDWFAKAYGAALATTTALAALRQAPAAHEAVQRAVENYDDLRFTAFQMLVPLTGSVVLALAVMDGYSDLQDIERAIYAEEDYKAGLYDEARYGAAPQQEKARAALRRDLQAGRQLLELLNG